MYAFESQLQEIRPRNKKSHPVSGVSGQGQTTILGTFRVYLALLMCHREDELRDLGLEFRQSKCASSNVGLDKLDP